MHKRLICMLCCALLAFSSTVALAEQTFSMAGFDGDDSNHDWNTNRFFTRMQARTGVSFTFSEYTDYAKWNEAKRAMFASGELPDVLFKADLSTAEQINWSESGQLIDLKPLLAENAPHLWALLQEHPDWLDAITLPSGKIAALPALTEAPTQNVMWINQTWLDALHLDMPTDTESLRAVLEAFKTGDPNGNGQKEEIPLAFLGPWDLKFLSHAFGAVANDYNIYVDETGTVRYLPAQESFTALVRWLRGLYADGLMDASGFYTSDTLRNVTDDKAVATYGVFLSPNPMAILTYKLSEEYRLLMPLTFEGKQVYRELFGSVTRGTFAITSACKDPAALLRWVDELYSEEGAIEALAGTLGEDYTVDEDGRWDYAGGEESMTSAMFYDLSVYDSGNMPWLFPTSFYNRYTNESIGRISAELEALSALTVKPFPTYTLTLEQEAQVVALQNELGRYVDESLAQFVLGQLDSNDDTAIEAFHAGLVSHGMDDMVAFWQQIYDGLQK